MIRRFANIVAEKGSSGNYSLHRLDISKCLFYPSTAVADAANKKTGKMKKPGKMATLQRLPPPVMRFHPLPSVKIELFALLCPRRSEDRIICGDSDGHTVVYNANAGSAETMPSLNGGKGFMPATISIARPDAPLEDLYVLSSGANTGDRLSCFDVLNFSNRSRYQGMLRSNRKSWRCDPLPPPPFTANLCSHTVLDNGRTICVSATPSCGRTYYFDTVKREWRQAAGDWVLPFVGGAEYIPDLKLWLGFDADSHNLCAWDISAMDKPATLRYDWTGLKIPEDWLATRLSLLNLGAGRFCIAKVFRVVRSTGGGFADLETIEDKFAVFTGVEVVTGDGNQIERIVEHKSVLYMFMDDKIRWVL